MFKTLQGIFRDGKVELLEPAPRCGEVRVLVTFLSPVRVVLAESGINESQAVNLRYRLSAIVDDWERPEMSVYDEL